MQPTALVTGASSGLGRAIARELARRGYRVFAGIRSEADAQVLAADHPAIAPVRLDVARSDDIARAAAEVDAACGPDGLALLVNNAGYALYTPIEYADSAAVGALFDVVAFAPYRLANALLPALKRHGAVARRRAKILNIISWGALDASPFVGFYAAAKAAALRLTQAQAMELEAFAIDAVAVLPGMMRTPFVGGAHAQLSAAIAELPPRGRDDYGGVMARMAAMSETAPRNPIAADPAAVARRIVAIARTRRPREEYYLGIDTRLVRWIARLPHWLRRRIRRAIYGFNRPRALSAG